MTSNEFLKELDYVALAEHILRLVHSSPSPITINELADKLQEELYDINSDMKSDSADDHAYRAIYGNPEDDLNTNY